MELCRRFVCTVLFSLVVSISEIFCGDVLIVSLTTAFRSVRWLTLIIKVIAGYKVEGLDIVNLHICGLTVARRV